MKKLMIFAIGIFSVIGLVACQHVQREDVGMVAGGAAGALVGSQIGSGTGRSVAIGAGAVTGAVIGRHLAK